MIFLTLPISILEVLIITVPALLAVAFVTIAERKTMASMQRRVGPNTVGYYGLLQAFADALKLIIKEYVSPTQANLILFFLGPIVTLVFSLLGYAVIPYGPGLAIFDFDLGILYFLAVSSLATYGILLAGWSANSKYAFLGSLRSTAQLISYELILTSAVLVVILLTSSLNLTTNIESQKSIWFLLPLFPLFIIFFISSVAETNRAPFDLAEAESELVSGFMTEHSAVIFVFFFLAEYASLVLMCIVVTILFIGGYNFDFIHLDNFYHLVHYIIRLFGHYFDKLTLLIPDYEYGWAFTFADYPLLGVPTWIETEILYKINSNTSYISQDISYHLVTNPITAIVLYPLILGVKALIMVFVFIWVRASFPRIRFDQLMSYSWIVLLPLVFAFIIAIPVLINVMDIMPQNNLV